ncbi:hypothetical protein DPMN_117552 [Dreissena polymorpha]|uniref:Uncharacterized protein n=1 Tax=Dreissena polymorpha TaxID=45954 RepID=A0A9D4KQJ4_DREPO|nr:hypothetical protein DPMN_117552 [Dreissena polymorpha]
MFPKTWIITSEEYWDNQSILQADIRQRYYYKTVTSKRHLKTGVPSPLRYIQTIIHDGHTFKEECSSRAT